MPARSKDLELYSEEQLLAELNRRKVKAKKPDAVPLEKVDWSKVHALALTYVQHLEHEDYDETSYKAFIADEVLKAIYGDGFEDWVNSINR